MDFTGSECPRELKIEIRNESLDKPAGNYNYEQLIAECANFNAKPMIEEAACFLAERDGFTPGRELSCWLQAESGLRVCCADDCD